MCRLSLMDKAIIYAPDILFLACPYRGDRTKRFQEPRKPLLLIMPVKSIHEITSTRGPTRPRVPLGPPRTLGPRKSCLVAAGLYGMENGELAYADRGSWTLRQCTSIKSIDRAPVLILGVFCRQVLHLSSPDIPCLRTFVAKCCKVPKALISRSGHKVLMYKLGDPTTLGVLLPRLVATLPILGSGYGKVGTELSL
jgi:hypothetical protein